MDTEAQVVPSLPVTSLASVGALSQLSDLLDSVFSLPQGRRFLDDFPVWSPEFKLDFVEHWGVLDAGKLVSSAGLRMAELKASGSATIRIGIIGAVGTLTDYRGRGLATRVIQKQVAMASKKGANAVLLWSGEHSFYRRLGFELCGQQVQFPLADMDLETRLPASKDATVHTGWTPELFTAMQTRAGGLVLESSDLEWLAAHRNVQWFYSKGTNGIQAYAALGRGIDLTHFIHEWGGSPEDLRQIFKHIHRAHPLATLLGSPQMLRERQFPFSDNQIEFLCFGKILDPNRLFQAFYPAISAQVSTQPDGWKLELEGRKVFDVTHQELIHLILGPYALNPNLPFWVWGLDSA